MSCYLGGEHRYSDSPESWLDYDHILSGPALVEILQTIDVKRAFMGIGFTSWPTIGGNPDLDTLGLYDWESNPDKNPLGTIKAIMVHARNLVSNLIPATYVDEDCVKWRWTHQTEMTAALPGTTPPDRKEDWKAWVDAMREVLELMTENISDAWETGAVELIITVDTNDITGERYMQEADCYPVGGGVFSFRTDGDYNRYGDTSGVAFSDSLSTYGIPDIGPGGELSYAGLMKVGQTVGDIGFGASDEYGVIGCTAIGPAFGRTNDDPLGSAIEGNMTPDGDYHLGGKVGSRSGQIFTTDTDSGVSTDSGYACGLDPASPTLAYYPDLQGWFKMTETVQRYKIEFQDVPGDLDGSATLSWVASTAPGEFGNPLYGDSLVPEAPTIITQDSTEVTISSTSPAYMEVTATLDETSLPIDSADFPADAQVYASKIVVNITGAYIVGDRFLIPYCRDACGNAHLDT